MEAGKWIVFAFLLGCVLVGFKTRQLKWYEFAVSGLFLVLLDGLVFRGEISRWVGQLGSNLQGAAAHASAGSLLLLGPASRERASRFVRRVWAQRPLPVDYLLLVGCAFLTRMWFDLPMPAGLAMFAAVLLGATITAAALNPEPGDQGDAGARGVGDG
jgi:hypothetical protein